MIQPTTLLNLTTSPLALSPVAIGGAPAFDLSLAEPGLPALLPMQPLAAPGKPLPPVLSLVPGAGDATVSLGLGAFPLAADLPKPFRPMDPPPPPAAEVVPPPVPLVAGAVRQAILVSAPRPSAFSPRILAATATACPSGAPSLDVAADGEPSPVLVDGPIPPASGGKLPVEEAPEARTTVSACGKHEADRPEPEQTAVADPSEPRAQPPAAAAMQSIVSRPVTQDVTRKRSEGEERPEPCLSPVSDIPSEADRPIAAPTASPIMVELTQPDLVPTNAPVVRPGPMGSVPSITTTTTSAPAMASSEQPTGAAVTSPRTLRDAPSKIVSTPLPARPFRSPSIDQAPEQPTLPGNDATTDIIGETAGSSVAPTASLLADPAHGSVDPSTAAPAPTTVKPVVTTTTINHTASSVPTIPVAAPAQPFAPYGSRETESPLAVIPPAPAAGPAPVAAKGSPGTRAVPDIRVPADPVDVTGSRPVSSAAEGRGPTAGPTSAPSAVAAAASAAPLLTPRPAPFEQTTPLAAAVLPASSPTLVPTAQPVSTAATISAAVPATPSAPDSTGRTQRPDATIAEPSLARVTLASPGIALPASGAQPFVAGTAAPAFRVFAAAIHAARADEADRTAPNAPTPIAAIEQARAALPVSSAQGQSLDMTDHRWPHAMVDRIERLQEAASATRDAASTSIRLVPDALGTIDVAVRRDGDTVHVHFNAENAQTRTLIADAQPRLQELAEAKGIRLAQANVGTGAEGQAQRQPAHQSARMAAAPNGVTRDEDTELSTTTRIG